MVPMPNRSLSVFATSISSASTAEPLTTARKELNDSCPRTDGCALTGSPVAGGSSDYRFLFRAGAGDWAVLEGAGQHRRGLLHGRTRDDSLGGRPGILVGEPGIAGTDGLGR